LIWSFVRNRNRSLERQLRRALAKNQLDVVYQPVVDMTSGRMVGAEALARWKCDTGLPVSPDVFVRIAEQRGFVGEITRCVVNRALDEFAPVIRRNPQFRLAVNVAAADMSDAAFLPMLAAALERTGVAHRNVVIELTETCTAQREEAIETIRLLRQAGHQVHIDDFGTGYSSLSYLKDLAVDAIKIDQSFTQAIGTESVTVAILPQILAIAEALNVDVTVEGVETARQAAYFMNSRVPIFAQGWLFGRPAPIEEFVCMLNASTAKAEREWAAEDETEFALPVGAM
jgi:sensor c-di-GMP phosphodiesterase-like protein